MTSPDSTDVLVVGAGPVGLSLAIDLRRRGIRVRLIDELAEPSPRSRAIVIHSRTLDHFESLGVLQPVLDAAIVSTGMEMHADGRTVAVVAFDHIDTTRKYSVSIPQSDTEAILAARLAELGLEPDRGRTLTALVDHGDGVTATVTGHGGETETIDATYVVGADGARSVVRHLTGQQLEGSFAGEDIVLADVDAEHPYEHSHFHGFFSPGISAALLFPLKGDRVRMFAQLPPGTAADRPVTVEWVQQLLTERGVDARITATHWLSRFELKHGQVKSYRVGRVFLAGDAAHIHSPAGALGMNTGIQDAVNLAWKLARAVRGEGHETLLDSYHAERHPVGAQVVALTTKMTQVGMVHSPIAQRLRNAAIHTVAGIPPLVDLMADELEEQKVNYRHSAIVAGSGHRVHPGDFLHLPDTSVSGVLAGADDHLFIAVPPDTADATAVADGGVSTTLTRGDLEALQHIVGATHGGLVVVRPDGYIGYVGRGGDDAVEAYRTALRS